MKPIRAVPEPWLILIDRYAAALRVKGHPETTIGTQRQHLQFLARRIGHPPSEVTHGILVEWCSQQKWARESRRGRQNTFRYFWRWAKKHAGLKNVAKKLPKVKAIPGTARPAPEGVYLRALIKSDSRTRLILRLAGECGLRRGEIALTNSHDLIDDLIGWSIYVHGKGGKTRIVPLPDGLARELLDLPSGWFFPGQINGHLSPRRVGELATDVLEDEWTLHTLRHRFATRSWQIDRDLLGLQELLGHASPATTRGYVKQELERLRAMVQRVAGETPRDDLAARRMRQANA